MAPEEVNRNLNAEALAEAPTMEAAQRRIVLLRSFVEASKALNSTLDLNQLLNIILDLATKNTEAEAGTIYLLDRERSELRCTVSDSDHQIDIRLPVGTGVAGYVAQTGEDINLENAYSHPRFKATYDQISGFQTTSMLCTPMRDAENSIIGVFQIMNKKSGLFTTADVEFLSGLSIHAALAIRQAALHKEAIEKKKLEHEIVLARNIQQRLLPKNLPQIASYDFAGINLPSEMIGGDYYDFISLEDGRLCFVIGDVAGKGIPAAYLMATLRTALHAHSPGSDSASLVRMMSKINRLIHSSSPPNMFATLFYGILEPELGRVFFVNAGHNPPMFLKDDGRIQALTTKGITLGLKREAQYELSEIQVNNGDVILLYTDGVTEAMDEQYREYGEDRLSQLLQKNRGLTANEILTRIVEDVQLYRGQAPQNDDITLAVIKR
jgi:sigma-B regulation protein RsbU (phosphoserine phosphatase)